jgi:regulator of protease activity HflC (stomatin/prohibitin superfamily)
VSLRIQELNVELETKTKDNVFVIVKVSVQYQAIREKIYSAFYVLSELDPQMTAYVFDVVRAALCTMTLDHAFESKEEISTHLKSRLGLGLGLGLRFLLGLELVLREI